MVQRDIFEQCAHIAQVADGHADFADFTAGKDVVTVVAGLGWQIKSDGKTGLTLGEVAAI